MIVKTLDGDEYDWTIPDQKERKRSKLHQTAKLILRAKYPNIVIYDEVPIQVRKKQRLYLDLYCPTLLLAVEVNGQQHYTFNSHFHSSKAQFLHAVSNDLAKVVWCELNDIELITLKYNELKEWDKQL